MVQVSSKSSSSREGKAHLPPLAPRERPSSPPQEPSSSTASRAPRLSHRSRAGCRTCRGRKVRCNEIKPVCGPCMRLGRDCDWSNHWTFSDVTGDTQNKYGYITTAGSAAWDPSARRSSTAHERFDDLPAFHVLKSDEDRERKAELGRPGTYGVVVTPESFFDLPEYAAASSPGSYQAGSRASLEHVAHTLRQDSGRVDPNFVVLDRFEDRSHSAGHSSVVASHRRQSVAAEAQRGSSSTSSTAGSSTRSSASPVRAINANDRLLSHFRSYVIQRIVQPLVSTSSSSSPLNGPTTELLESAATRFPPASMAATVLAVPAMLTNAQLQQAIRAVSALNLAYNGRGSLEDAMQYYHQALSATTPTTPNDLLSDGVFFRHFLLFIYDLCLTMHTEPEGADMWALHLNHLREIAVQRHAQLGREPHGFVIWLICELDMEACLLGSGSCEFLRSVLEKKMLPALEHQLPNTGLYSSGADDAVGAPLMTSVLRLREGIVLRTSRLAHLAHSFRVEASGHAASASPSTYARWQARVSLAQGELLHFWTDHYPRFLGAESPTAGHNLPPRARYVFEYAFLLYHAAVIYSRTSMFSAQRLLPTADQAAINADTARRCISILTLAADTLSHECFEYRHIVFPVFLAGVVSIAAEVKLQAVEMLRKLEGSGIGQNTYRTRKLLMSVCEEQRRVVAAGGRMEQIEWMAVARERGLQVVNCGL